VLKPRAILDSFVSYDPDLLDLKKPQGILCVTPRAFLSAVLRQQ
jgi:hypothetical protein